MESQKSSHHIRVRNVSFHRRGRPEYGTLYLTKHHLIFQYQTTASGSRIVPSPHASTTSSSTNLTKLANETSHHENGSNAVESGQTPSKNDSKGPVKEIYVPFPLVHHCVLRPSNAISSNIQATMRPKPDAQVDDDDLFPPTYGTSSHTMATSDSPRASPARLAETNSTSSSARPPAIRIRCKDFASFALHFHGPSTDKTPDDAARQVFYALRSRCCVSSVEDMYAFHFKPPAEETATGGQPYDARKEFARMGIRSKAPEGPGSAWRITDINNEYQYSPTYPSVLVTPRVISDNVLKYLGGFRSKARIPALSYLHPNGGSITRSSQPLVGVQGKRNPQDEKLVMAIFSSHAPKKSSPDDSPTQQALRITDNLEDNTDLSLDDENTTADLEAATKKKVYGSTRRNYIIDARPKLNAMANKAGGGGVEDIANYTSAGEAPLDKVFLGIANIHVMRKSLEKVVVALGNSDYLDLAPNQDLLKSSGWLGHIANMLSGAEMVARIVGLGGSHALVHCSDGWDRTAQIAALAQLMLDPYYRTLTGFITLVQKDFLTFGHKFRHRQGTEGSEKWFEIENERIAPARAAEGADVNHNLQAFGTKALTGARTWFEKNKNTIFRQQSPSGAGGGEIARPSTPPAGNPIIHSSPTPSAKEEKHKMEETEVSPVFHQFLECVYQLLYQEPSAFEFNERFLRRLLYQSYSGQYGEFLFNNERERQQYEGRTGSVWANFLARKQEFTNPEYALKADDVLLLPRRCGPEREIEVRWWHTLFGRKDDEMNIPKAAAIEPILPVMSTISLDDEAVIHAGDDEQVSRSSNRSGTPQITSDIPDGADSGQMNVAAGVSLNGADKAQRDIVASTLGEAETTTVPLVSPEVKKQKDEPIMTAMEFDEGDSLGASPGASRGASLRGGLDFAAFARSSAYSDR